VASSHLSGGKRYRDAGEHVSGFAGVVDELFPVVVAVSGRQHRLQGDGVRATIGRWRRVADAVALAGARQAVVAALSVGQVEKQIRVHTAFSQLAERVGPPVRKELHGSERARRMERSTSRKFRFCVRPKTRSKPLKTSRRRRVRISIELTISGGIIAENNWWKTRKNKPCKNVRKPQYYCACQFLKIFDHV